jgi:hypothetical protein
MCQKVHAELHVFTYEEVKCFFRILTKINMVNSKLSTNYSIVWIEG